MTWLRDVIFLFVLGPPCADIQMDSPSQVFLCGTCLLPSPYALHGMLGYVLLTFFFVPRWHHPMVATIKVRPVVRNHHGSSFQGTYETTWNNTVQHKQWRWNKLTWKQEFCLNHLGCWWWQIVQFEVLKSEVRLLSFVRTARIYRIKLCKKEQF